MRTLGIIAFSVACALLLTLFSHIQDMMKYIFSLGALYAGIQFFRRYDTKGARIVFVILSIVLYFVFTLIYAFYMFAKTGEIPNAGM
ncbi:hypothetical protein [Paenibacillus thalictri]|uniref:DUF3953 domain-containing protein n=1 Tax=Paenibacillus thalictri TaxID=2527873 RepID=A0A4Q9DRR7_9BACL|nr:hypothetical protein [Paenibacillus thalictri]TBL78341.1 hypothetical protein EYB31_15880 [Paenibacillus thalictri]